MYMYDPNWKPLVFFLYSKCYLIFVPYFWNKMILFARKNIIIFIPVFKTISNLKISIKYIYTFYFLIKKSHFEKTKDIYIYIYTYIFDIYCQCCNVFANGCIYIRGSVLTLVKANAVERLGNTLYPSLLGKGIWPWSWITTLAPAVSLSSAMYCDCSINRLSFNPDVYKCIQEWFTPRIHYSFSLI